MNYVYAGILFVGVIYASLMEYLLHRHIMHKPFKITINLFGFKRTIVLMYPFRQHTLVHHEMYDAGETYHCINPDQDIWTIPMAWWNGPVLILIASIPAMPFIALDWKMWLWFTIAIAGYYCLYESMHWAMHLKKRWLHFLRLFPVFRWLNGHHLLHHKYMWKNYNVVLPLWDLLCGTLQLRATKPFKQARDVLLPDVQPRTESRSAFLDL